MKIITFTILNILPGVISKPGSWIPSSCTNISEYKTDTCHCDIKDECMDDIFIELRVKQKQCPECALITEETTQKSYDWAKLFTESTFATSMDVSSDGKTQVSGFTTPTSLSSTMISTAQSLDTKRTMCSPTVGFGLHFGSSINLCCCQSKGVNVSFSVANSGTPKWRSSYGDLRSLQHKNIKKSFKQELGYLFERGLGQDFISFHLDEMSISKSSTILLKGYVVIRQSRFQSHHNVKDKMKLTFKKYAKSTENGVFGRPIQGDKITYDENCFEMNILKPKDQEGLEPDDYSLKNTTSNKEKDHPINKTLLLAILLPLGGVLILSILIYICLGGNVCFLTSCVN